jgi:hypothetical protein
MLLNRRYELDQCIPFGGALDQPDVIAGHPFAVTFS